MMSGKIGKTRTTSKYLGNERVWGERIWGPQYKNRIANMKIKTNFDYPPIPIRTMDWSAWDDSTYDGPGCKVGQGATEREAVQDLLDQLDNFVDYTLEQLDREGKIIWTTKR
jgi:hypothetical protein